MRTNQRPDQQASSGGSRDMSIMMQECILSLVSGLVVREIRQMVERREQEDNGSIICTAAVLDAYASSRRQGRSIDMPNFDVRA
ncbi:hypothetical protein GX50_02146 [[Emmonsia] crescens]|uniref:Uncharacterized protein n=1 Tax=[Emmonsia] crescens TaxID=73230 RepID=A0A2B7ZPS3_9EURO|nr:hypothetical protein GX50_02146 [Emmonsia crescens]